MDLSTETVGNILVIAPMFRHVDAANSKEFKEAIVPLLAQSGHVLIDLSEIQFLDSSGLGVLLSCLRHAKRGGGELKLCGLTRPVHVLFELVRMHRVFEIFPARDEALRSFAS